jgi:hypothetical protein
VNLRGPTARETSGAWVRCLAAGKPTIITDLVHLGDVPALDLRSMRTVCTDPAAGEPVAVTVELTDDINMIRIAFRRLTEDAVLRARLGKAARRYWETHATMDLMVADYVAAIERARALPAPVPPPDWPPHLRADGTERARELAAHVGVRLY